jgi:hypothetical protein
MNLLVSSFINRFGEHRVKCIDNPLHTEQKLALLFLELDVPVTVLTTIELSTFKMPVLESWAGREHNEIFFCLPSHWDFEDIDNPTYAWVYEWLYKLETFVKERNTWFGPGHTIPTANPEVPISDTMRQEYFIFMDPILLEQELAPITIQGNTIHFLAVIPIFGDELDYKMGKGTLKFRRRFIQRKNTEKLDEFRKSFMTSRMRFF